MNNFNYKHESFLFFTGAFLDEVHHLSECQTLTENFLINCTDILSVYLFHL